MTADTADLQLVRTKLNRPRLASDLVPRPRLLERLNQPGHRLLTLVSAPAGCGKTTLVSAWLDTWDGPSAWLSLDERDSDLTAFLSYFIASIRTIFPQAGPESASLLRAASLPPVPVIGNSLINDLSRVDQPFILVLDDYHSIHEPSVHELLTELLRHPPEGLHLALVTRRDPPLPLARIRARGLVTEIRTLDLRFTTSEVQALLQQWTGTRAGEATVSLLSKKTEGWITGLRLALLSLRHPGDLDDLVSKLQGSSNYVTDYLVSEVLSRLPLALQDLLVKSSILDRFCGPLCDALQQASDMGPPFRATGAPGQGGRAYLERLAKEHLFVVPLDDQGEWYRCHHLFQQFLLHQLRRQLAADQITALHVRAADWFAQNGLIEDALHHALAAGDVARAIRWVAEYRHTLMNRDDWQRLTRWVRLFPRAVVEAEPELLIAEAWTKQVQWQVPEMAARLARIETLLAEAPASLAETHPLQSETNALRAAGLAFSAATEDSLSYLEGILSTIPRQHYYVRGYASMLLGCAYQMNGDLGAAVALASEGLQEIPISDIFQTRLLGMLSMVYWMDADLENLLLTATRCLAISRQADAVLSMTASHHYLGCVHYHRNNLDAAASAFAAAVDRPYLTHALTLAYCGVGLASTYQAQGQPDRAWEAADSIVVHMRETQNALLLPAVQAFQAELAARQGRLEEASRWVEQVGSALRPSGLPGFFGPQLALPKILLAQNTAKSRQQAAEYLPKLRAFLESIHNTRFLIETLALQALLYEAEGNRPNALDALAQAIIPAQPGGFIRLFVDLGPQLEPLLVQLAQDGVTPAYIAQILDAFPVPAPPEGDLSLAVMPQLTQRRSHPELVETLTNREMDVLLLLAERLTNKEIAQRLGISSETVKRHASSLYQKLDVHNRRQAAARARALGLLPAD
jgi:LuxR family maltose regulon positive regulatory protein